MGRRKMGTIWRPESGHEIAPRFRQQKLSFGGPHWFRRGPLRARPRSGWQWALRQQGCEREGSIGTGARKSVTCAGKGRLANICPIWFRGLRLSLAGGASARGREACPWCADRGQGSRAIPSDRLGSYRGSAPTWREQVVTSGGAVNEAL